MSFRDPLTKAEEWISDHLAGDAAVATAIGDRWWSGQAPGQAQSPYVVYDIAGAEMVGPIGPYAPTGWCLTFMVTAWNDQPARDDLGPAINAVLTALVGDGEGKSEHWQANDGSHWTVNAVYKGLAPIPMLTGMFGEEGFASRVAHMVDIELQLRA